MQDAFPIVIVVVLIGSAIGAVFAGLGAGEDYRRIGRGGLSLNDGTDRPAHEPTRAAAAGEREAEIRQMLEARNVRRRARGQETTDVEAELSELLGAPAVLGDPGLEAEIRELMIARNERRARQGKPPLDVEAEVRRSLRELS